MKEHVPDRRMFQARLREKGLGSQLAFIEKSEDPAADLFLFFPEEENSGLPILKLMARGLAGVLYELPILKEIDRKSAGFKIVPQGNTEAATEALSWLATHPDERLAMGGGVARDHSGKIFHSAIHESVGIFTCQKPSAHFNDVP